MVVYILCHLCQPLTCCLDHLLVGIITARVVLAHTHSVTLISLSLSLSLSGHSDSCLENDTISLLDKGLDDQGDTASIRSRGSIHSVGSGEQQRGLPMPRLEPFSPGQVFYWSQGRQVLVLPVTDDHVMEVNVT